MRYADDKVAVEYANAYLGDLFLTLKKLDLAEEHIKKAINIKPDNPAYRYLLGFVYSLKQQWDKAISEFEMAVAGEPKDGEYLRGLGWAICSSGNTAKGLILLEQASRLAPDNVNILTDLAVAHLGKMNFQRAKKYAKKAVRIAPANPLARDVMEKVVIFSDEFYQRNRQAANVKAQTSKKAATHFIHRFKVSLKDKPEIWRIIDIQENQMLSSLHKAIFKAFDRFEEHEYSFFLNNNQYDNKNAYHSPRLKDGDDDKLATRIRVDSIHLYGGHKFLYLFDYGDEWWHEVELVEVIKRITRASYPRIVKKQGKSPPQYPGH